MVNFFGKIQKSDLQEPPKFKQFLLYFFKCWQYFWLPIIIIDFDRLNLAIETKFYKKLLASVAVEPNFGRTNCLNFEGSWRSDFWIFPKKFSIDLLHRLWNGSYCYFFWIGEIANLSNTYKIYYSVVWSLIFVDMCQMSNSSLCPHYSVHNFWTYRKEKYRLK